MSREMALAAYRHVLRAVRVAFQGDPKMLLAARVEARNKFEQNRGLSTNSEEAAKGVEHAEAVATILRQNIVQAEKVEGEGEDRFRLRMHEETERGDNETVKIGSPGWRGC